MDFYAYIDYMIVREDVDEKVRDFYNIFRYVANYLSEIFSSNDETSSADNELLSLRVYENLMYIAKSDSIAEIKEYILTLKLLLGQIKDIHNLKEQNLDMQICEAKNLFVKLSLIIKLKKEKKFGKHLDELEKLCQDMNMFVDPYLNASKV